MPPPTAASLRGAAAASPLSFPHLQSPEAGVAVRDFVEKAAAAMYAANADKLTVAPLPDSLTSALVAEVLRALRVLACYSPAGYRHALRLNPARNEAMGRVPRAVLGAWTYHVLSLLPTPESSSQEVADAIRATREAEGSYLTNVTDEALYLLADEGLPEGLVYDFGAANARDSRRSAEYVEEHAAEHLAAFLASIPPGVHTPSRVWSEYLIAADKSRVPSYRRPGRTTFLGLVDDAIGPRTRRSYGSIYLNPGPDELPTEPLSAESRLVLADFRKRRQPSTTQALPA